MKNLKKRIGSALLITLVLTVLLAATVLAGSPKASFSVGVPDIGIYDRSEQAYKSDAGTTSGNHATVVVTTVTSPGRNSSAVLYVENLAGLQVSGMGTVSSTGSINLPYNQGITVANGYYRLVCYSEDGAIAVSGYWYP